MRDIAMRDPIERYIEDVLCYADLARGDERSVGAELSEHLHEIAPQPYTSTPMEVYNMLKDEFGNPKRIGQQIAAAKGRIRTYFKKRVRRLPLKIGIALVLAFAVRYAVAEEFYVAGNGVAPVIPLGSRVFVYKLVKSFSPGDVVVYKLSNGENRVGTIDKQTTTGSWLIERNTGGKKEVQDIVRENIVGRVFLNTR